MSHQPITSLRLLTPSLLTVILLIVTLMQLSADLYTPSLPAIASALSSNTETIQLTLSLFMLGFGASHVFYGPLSDRIGRKTPMVLGIGISIIGSLICYHAMTATTLILGRFIQGFGIGCCNSVGRSVARDLLHGRMLAKIGSQIGMVSVIILAISPTIGGYVQHYFGWRANFLLLLVFNLFVWLLVLVYLPETNQHKNPAATQFRVMAHNYGRLLRSRAFMGYTLCACSASAGIIAYFTIAPFLFQIQLGLTPVQFGWLAFIVAGSIFVSGFINTHLVLRKGVRLMVLWGCIFMLIGGCFMLLFICLGLVNIIVIMLPMSIFSIGAGLTFINAFAGAFNPFPKMAGTTGALYGCLQDLSSAFASAIVAIVKETDQTILALLLIVVSILALLSWRYLANQTPVQADPATL